VTTSAATGRISADWTIGGKPNGGYLLEMLGRATSAVSPHPHPIAASAHYLHSPDPAPVDIDVELLRAGRSASQARARMSQDGRACVEALFTLAALPEMSAASWQAGLPAMPQTPFAECIRARTPTPTGIPIPMLDQVDLRVDPATAGFMRGRPSGRGELRGWLALLDGQDFDPCSLLFAVDAFPPATFDVELTGWVPTLELTAYVRGLPAPGPVRVLHVARLVQDQRVDEACFVWDAEGRLVAQSTQLAGVRIG
jgi:hypothetical protein